MIAKRIISITNDTAEEQKDSEEVLMRSHYAGEAWGLAVYKHYIYTCGDDNQLIKWDIKRRTAVDSYLLWTKENEKSSGIGTLPQKDLLKKKNTASSLSKLAPAYQARALAISERHKHLAVGFNDGKVVIKKLSDPSTNLHVLYESNEWSEVMEYSPDQDKLAVGSHDNNIYVYNVTQHGYALYTTLKAHTSYISALDWSEDGSYIRSNCGAYELLFFNLDTKSQDPSGASNTRNTEWATQNCKLAWNVQGIYPFGTDGSHINGVAMLKERKLIATGDDYGLVNLYRDPCLEDTSIARSYRGHSEHVVRIRFVEGGKYMVSVGGYDQTVIQWKRNGEETDEESEGQEESEEEETEEVKATGSHMQISTGGQHKAQVQEEPDSDAEDSDKGPSQEEVKTKQSAKGKQVLKDKQPVKPKEDVKTKDVLKTKTVAKTKEEVKAKEVVKPKEEVKTKEKTGGILKTLSSQQETDKGKELKPLQSSESPIKHKQPAEFTIGDNAGVDDDEYEDFQDEEDE